MIKVTLTTSFFTHDESTKSVYLALIFKSQQDAITAVTKVALALKSVKLPAQYNTGG